MEFTDWLKNITLGQVFSFIAGCIAVISVFVEFNKKIPFHPLTSIVAWFGRAITRDLRKSYDEFQKKLDANTKAINELKQDMEVRFEKSATEADTKEAKRLRSRIIDFADSCRVHQKHTKTAFENISRDYDDYCEYCERRDIPNHFIDAEFEYIGSVYAECQKENKFI